MLARRLTTILPVMRVAEALDTTRMHRGAGLTDGRAALGTRRPLRAPYQTIADVGLIGGGPIPLPGAESRAHPGVRFLDERLECRRMSSRGPASRSRRVSLEYDLPHVINLAALVVLTARPSLSIRSSP